MLIDFFFTLRKYGLKTSANFVFGIKQGDDYFLVKINKDLTDFSKPQTNVVMTNFSLVNESDGQSGTNGLIKKGYEYFNN